MSLLIFLFVLSVLIIVHEMGHLVAAKSVGVKVEKFSLGFGPKIFSRVIAGTEYILGTIPLGGYVKMAGDERPHCQGGAEEFFSHPVWHRALIVVMGPVVNLVFAYLCFYVVFLLGFPSMAPQIGSFAEPRIDKREVKRIVPSAPSLWDQLVQKGLIDEKGLIHSSVLETVIAESVALPTISAEEREKLLQMFQDARNVPAQQAGLLKGDVVLSINEKPVRSWEDIQENVFHSQGQALRFQVDRQGAGITTVLHPKQRIVKDLFGHDATIWLIGIQPGEDIIFLSFDWKHCFSLAGQQIQKIFLLTFKALYHVFAGSMAAKDAFAGPIRLFDVIRDAALMGILPLVLYMGIISTSLAIFNLFPIPVLDGGHLFLLAVEKIRCRPLSVKVEEGLTRVGIGLLLSLMVFVFYNDMLEVGWFDKIKILSQKILK